MDIKLGNTGEENTIHDQEYQEKVLKASPRKIGK